MSKYRWHQLGWITHAVILSHWLEPIDPGDEVTCLCMFTTTVLAGDQLLSNKTNVVPCMACFAEAKKLAGMERSNVGRGSSEVPMTTPSLGAHGRNLAAAGLIKAMEALRPALAEMIEGQYAGRPVNLLALADLTERFSKMLRTASVIDGDKVEEIDNSLKNTARKMDKR